MRRQGRRNDKEEDLFAYAYPTMLNDSDRSARSEDLLAREGRAMGVSTCDLYEGSYYLLRGCELQSVEALRLDGELRCRMSFEGQELPALQVTYLQGQAAANLFAFRRAYSQLSSIVLRAKRKAREERRGGGLR